MRVVGWTLAFAVVLLVGSAASGSVISLSDQGAAANAVLGVRVYPSSFDTHPLFSLGGELAVLGVGDLFLQNTTVTHTKSGVATFDHPAARITFEVANQSGSLFRDEFSVIAFSKGKRVKSETVMLQPIGDLTEITIAGPAIDKVIWNGDATLFQPYQVRDLLVKFAPQAEPPPDDGGGGTKVGTSVPEPGSVGLLAVIAVIGLMRRKRIHHPENLPAPL